MTSDIRPIYVFTGVFAETLWSTAGHGHVGPDMPLCWNPIDKTMNAWRSGQAIWPWTTEHDAAEVTAAIVQHEDAALGGYWNQAPQQSTLISSKMVDENQSRCIDMKHNIHVTLKCADHYRCFVFPILLTSMLLYTRKYTRIFVFSITLASIGNDQQKVGPSATIRDLVWLTVAGPDWNVCSRANTLIDIAKMYEQERGVKVPLKWCDAVKELRAKALKSRAEGA
jgi:hypothetical protein